MPNATNRATEVATALRRHPFRRELVRAAHRRDQLLRSLIPLYVAAQLDLDLHSGEIARVWRHFRIEYAVPNAAKALREHIGFAMRRAGGRRITTSGVAYVEEEIFRPA